MQITDTIADILTRIRNASSARQEAVHRIRASSGTASADRKSVV